MGGGQTSSQPYIVALMTDRLDLDADDVVLDAGADSGYRAAGNVHVRGVLPVAFVPLLRR